jgi:hypothetical protein
VEISEVEQANVYPEALRQRPVEDLQSCDRSLVTPSIRHVQLPCDNSIASQAPAFAASLGSNVVGRCSPGTFRQLGAYHGRTGEKESPHARFAQATC